MSVSPTYLSRYSSLLLSVKMNEKYTVLTPFGVINKILGPGMFLPTTRETLGDKMEMYFHDPSFVPLFMQVRMPTPPST